MSSTVKRKSATNNNTSSTTTTTLTKDVKIQSRVVNTSMTSVKEVSPTKKQRQTTASEQYQIEKSNNDSDEYMEVLETRLHSMMQLRNQIEQLADAQKKEEGQYYQTIKALLKQTDKKQSSESHLKQTIEELELKYRNEHKEKLKAQKMFSTFRSEGSSIIYRLRDSLTRITQKYKAVSEKVTSLESKLADERRKNEELSQQYEQAMEILQKNGDTVIPRTEISSGSRIENSSMKSEKEKEYENKITNLKKSLARAKREIRMMRGDEKAVKPGSNSDSEEDTHWDSVELNRLKLKLRNEKEARAHNEKIVEEKFLQFQNLVEEEEQVIEKLKQKLKDSESNNEKMKQSLRKALRVNKTKQNESGDIPQEYVDLYTELKNLLDPEDNRNLQADQQINPYDKIKAQDRLIKLLLAKLKVEEEERKKSELQAAKIMEDQEKTVFDLEQKMHELVNITMMQKQEAEKDKTILNRILPNDLLRHPDWSQDEDRMLSIVNELKEVTKQLTCDIEKIGTPKRSRISDEIYQQQSNSFTQNEPVLEYKREEGDSKSNNDYDTQTDESEASEDQDKLSL